MNKERQSDYCEEPIITHILPRMDGWQSGDYALLKSLKKILLHFKSNLQWVITSHLLGWLLLKRQEITNANEDVEKKESMHTVVRNINW